MIYTDYHCHVLPEMDDGAKSTDISKKMLKLMRRQGIKSVVFTPHFYPHRERSVEDFLSRRKRSYRKISCKQSDFEFFLGAETAIEQGLSEIPDIKRLAIQGTSLILLEPPFSGYGSWVTEEIHNIVCETGLKPIIAHIHRYARVYSKAEMSELLSLDAVFQVNAEAFASFGGRRFVKKLLKSGAEVVFGSDAHNLDRRSPDYSRLCRYLKEDDMIRSDKILNRYRLYGGK